MHIGGRVLFASAEDVGLNDGLLQKHAGLCEHHVLLVVTHDILLIKVQAVYLFQAKIVV